MRHGSTLLLVSTLFVTGAGSGTAGDAGLSADHLGMRTAPLLLLTRPDVRADLSITAEQAASADRAIQDLYRRAEALKGQGNTPQVVAAREAIVLLDLNGTELTAKLPGRVRLKPGQTVAISADPDELHLFDAATEARIDASIGAISR